MTMSSGSKIDPSKIFVQADCFYQTLAILSNVAPDNTQLAVTLGEPAMVITALTIELFIKCLVAIETGDVPRGHHLKQLFDKLGTSTQNRIQYTWDNSIAAHRAEEWNKLEKSLRITIARDLPSALEVGSKAFERIRYSYEGNNEDLQFYLQDLPQLLGRVILEIKPEWKALRRNYQELVPPSAN